MDRASARCVGVDVAEPEVADEPFLAHLGEDFELGGDRLPVWGLHLAHAQVDQVETL